MKYLAEDMGVNFIWQQSGRQYPQSLTEAHSAILKANMNDEPIMILEDDVAWSGDSMRIEDVPDNADALYLGHSDCGNSLGGYSEFQQHSSKYFKVVSMMSSSSIIYISQRYKSEVVKGLDTHAGIALDITTSSLQQYFNVYTFNNPWFYQYNEGKLQTNLTVNEINNAKYRLWAKLLFGVVLLLIACMSIALKSL